MRSCRTASIFAIGALGVVVAVMAVGACREGMPAEIPPLTTATPDGAPLLGETAASLASTPSGASADDGGPSTSAVMAAALAEPPARVKFVDTPAKLEAGVCERTLVAVMKGKVTAMSETLGAGDVLVVESGDAFDATGAGTVVSAQVDIVPCPVRSRPVMTKTVIRASAAPKLEWAGGAMNAHLDVGPRVSPELSLGRLEGSAPVAEHSHAASWEIIAAFDANGTFVLDGTEGHLGPRQVLMVPPGAKHAWKPEPGSKLVAVQLYAPPGPEQRFVALAAGGKDAGAAANPSSSAR